MPSAVFTVKTTKQRWSSTILMILILLMFIFRTLRIASSFYLLWCAFIKHGDTKQDVFSALLTINEFDVFVFSKVPIVMSALEWGIADSILVCSPYRSSLRWTHEVLGTGVEMLDCLQS
jgi:glucan phosphoethanolaminetransferase (alkaline phosphatase superfamily)